MKLKFLMLPLVLGLSVAAADEPVQARMDADGVQRATIVGGSYFFEPAHLVVRVGQPVELTLRRESGLAPHDFQLEAPEAGLDIHVELETAVVRIEFTPETAGSYEFICTKNPPLLRSHRDRGMRGVLEVID